MHNCQFCQEPFKKKLKRQIYCSRECGFKAKKTIPGFNCKTCNKFVDHPRSRSQRYCSHQCVVIELPPAPPIEIITDLLIKHRFKDKPHWEQIRKALNVDVRTARRWAKEHHLIDDDNCGPIVNGQHLVIEYAPKPIDPCLISKEHLTERLMEKREVDEETHCWIWVGGWNKSGYGYMQLARPLDKKYWVHTIAAHIWLDEPLDTKRFVFHTCGVRACFNPEHFILCKDRKTLSKLMGKYHCQPRGENNGKTTISLAKALDIRDALKIGDETPRQIANRLEVNYSIVLQIAHRKSWKYIWKMKHEYQEA